MTYVVNGGGLTVIILETEEETQALLELLDLAPPDLGLGADPKSSTGDPWIRSAIIASDRELSTPSREAEQGAWLD